MIVLDHNGKVDEDLLTWSEVESTPEIIAGIFKDKQVLNVETIDSPATDGLVFALTDLQDVVFVEISVSEDLLYAGPAECVGMPLVVKVSEPVPVREPNISNG